MKTTLALLAALTFTATLQAADAKPLKVLLITGGCCHDYKTQTELLKKGIEERIHAGLATPEEAKTLKIRSGAPVLHVERIASTYRNLPVEYRSRVFDATRYHYRTVEGSA